MVFAEIVNETKFLRHVQEFIMPTLRSCTIPTMEDNQGAIKMANNKHSSTRTRHIDVKHLIKTPSRMDWSALFMLGVKSSVQTYSRML